MTDLRYDELSCEERAVICNGCGRKGGWLDPPDWIFVASCDRHDASYWIGCTEADRKRADQGFLSAMLEDASRAPWWSRNWYRFVAWTYYRAVRWFGASAFYYGPRKRTREDLDEHMRRIREAPSS